MADYEESPEIIIPDIGISNGQELGQTPNQIIIPSVGIVQDSLYTDINSIQAVYQYDHSITTYTDFTTEANSADVSDVYPFPSGGVGAGDICYLGSPTPSPFLTFNIPTPGVGTYTISYKYWNGASWVALTEVYDSSGDLKVLDYSRVHWVVPDDWVQVAVNGTTLYWIQVVYNSGTMTTRPIITQVWWYAGAISTGQIIVVM